MVDGDNVVLLHKVILNGDSVGTIYIQAVTQDLVERLYRFVLIEPVWSVVALYLAAAICYVVFLVSVRSRMYLADLQAVISFVFLRMFRISNLLL
jgi:hypothetical protein